MAEVKVRVTAENATRTGFQQALGEAKRFGDSAAGSIQNSFSSIAGGLKATFAGIFAGIGIGSLVRNTISELSNIGNLAQQFGVSAESLQRIGQVASESGVSIDQVGNALGRLTRSIQQAQGGTGAQAEAFRALGLSAKELAGLSPEQAFLRLADAVAGASDRNKAYAATIDVAGRSAGALIPILQQGSSALKEQFDLISVVSDETVAKIKQVEDQFSRLGKQITTSLGPPIAAVGQILLSFTEVIKNALSEAGSLFSTFGKAIDAGLRGNFGQIPQIFRDSVAEYEKEQAALEKRLGDIFANTPQETVRLALEATGLESAEELKRAIDSAESRTIEIALKASGLNTVEELNAAIIKARQSGGTIDLEGESGATSREAENAAKKELATRTQVSQQLRRLQDQQRTDEERLAALREDVKFVSGDIGGVSEQELERLRLIEQIFALEQKITQDKERAAQIVEREAQARQEAQKRDAASLANLARSIQSPDERRAALETEQAALAERAASLAPDDFQGRSDVLTEAQRIANELTSLAPRGSAEGIDASALQRVGLASNEFVNARQEDKTATEVKRASDFVREILNTLKSADGLYLSTN